MPLEDMSRQSESPPRSSRAHSTSSDRGEKAATGTKRRRGDQESIQDSRSRSRSRSPSRRKRRASSSPQVESQSPREDDRRHKVDGEGRSKRRDRAETETSQRNERKQSVEAEAEAVSSALPQTKDTQPPLPDEAVPPPLPTEPVPSETAQTSNDEDDGWQPVWDASAQAFYFYNRFTQRTQWENPRVPEATTQESANTATVTKAGDEPKKVHPAVAAGYNPAIHGDYDPNAEYAQPAVSTDHAKTGYTQSEQVNGGEGGDEYAATAQFNRFTGRFQAPLVGGESKSEQFTDEAKSRRQMNAYFDVDAAANSHDGRSLKAERQSKKLTKSEVKAFKERKSQKKEEKRRAWLRD